MRIMLRTLGILVAGMLVAGPALAQVYVVPRRPGKTNVRYYDQAWQYADLLVDTQVEDAPAGGVRLYFYEEEREVALLAAATIEDSYRYLANVFDYTPERRFPYILYSTYTEFLRTNLFPLQEGVLGVTSPRGLEITLPYFGDHKLFEEVSTHELVHEFTIQKVRSVTKAAKANRDPMNALPLWFIEGLAEFYAKRGLDPKTEMLVRDMVANPEIYQFHGVPEFWDDFPTSVLWTYKVGQMRVAYLEQTYGQGTLQRILEATPWMVQGRTGGGGMGYHGFSALVEHVTGDDREAIARGFDSWVKRRAFPEWLAGQQDSSDLAVLEDVAGIPNALVASPDDHLVMYRSIDPYTGRSRLYITDPRDHPRSQKRVAVDHVPGVESLHPIDDRNFDVRAGSLVYVAESRGHDVLFMAAVEHNATERDPPDDEADLESESEYWEDPVSEVRRYSSKIRLSDRRRFRLSAYGLIAAFSPSLSPDGSRVAFIGLSREGIKDLYLLTPGEKGNAEVMRLSDDNWAERDVYWGTDGLVFTSDATETGNYNIFRVDPDAGGAPEQLTTEARDHSAPLVTADGRILFLAWGAGGHADLYELTDEGVVQRTDMTTGVFEPSPGPEGDVWVLLYEEGQRVPARLGRDDLLSGEPLAQPPLIGRVAARPTVPLDEVTTYRASKPANWQPGVIFGYLGAGAGVVFGEVYATATDRLRDHSLVLTASIYGHPKLTDGYIAYMNQAGRISWGGGVFHELEFRLDKTFGNEVGLFTSDERFFGALVGLRYPMNRFSYIQVDQAAGGVEYFLFSNTADYLASEGKLNEWEAANGKIRFQTATSLRLGYDTIQYHALTGPLAGSSAMVELKGETQPMEGELFGSVRLDAEHYLALPLIEGANLGLRASGGSATGGRYARSFFLSSYDTLRGARFGDPEHLIGRHYYFANAELQVPLHFILRSAIASNIEAVAGVDFGAAGDELDDLWGRRILDVAFGGNVVFGPIMLRLHWARAINTGAPLPDTNRPWVPNISLTYVSF
ncbi:MAG: tolB protein precursor protein [Deltaproteobacteria bacterium]|nr:tolB protein precursor protein [Deltaproteobacteria bacterium]